MTDAELRDAAVAELKLTTAGWRKPNGQQNYPSGTAPATSHWGKAMALLGQIGQVVPPPPPPPPPPPTGSAPPAYSAVGASGALVVHSGGQLSGVSLSNKRFTGEVSFGSGDVTLTNCSFDGGIAVTFPGHGKVTLIHCTCREGWYFEDGGQGNVFLSYCLFEDNWLRAIRPKGSPGILTADDCWFRNFQQAPDGNHTEVMQVLLGGAGKFTRCAFSQVTANNNTVTAVVHMQNDGAGSSYTDCVFGNYNPTTSTWSRGGGYYMIYPGDANAVFVRPTIYSPSGTAADAWYSGQVPAGTIDPVYVAG